MAEPGYTPVSTDEHVELPQPAKHEDRELHSELPPYDASEDSGPSNATEKEQKKQQSSKEKEEKQEKKRKDPKTYQAHPPPPEYPEYSSLEATAIKGADGFGRINVQVGNAICNAGKDLEETSKAKVENDLREKNEGTPQSTGISHDVKHVFHQGLEALGVILKVTGEVEAEVGKSISTQVDPLPEPWEKKVTKDGRAFYINHSTKKTQWERPVVQQTQNQNNPNIPTSPRNKRPDNIVHPDPATLPFGYEVRTNKDGRIYYVNHKDKTTSWYPPNYKPPEKADSLTKSAEKPKSSSNNENTLPLD